MSKPGTNKVDYEVRDGVAIVTLDHFPVNTLTNAVQLGIEDAAEKVSKDGTIKAVVLRGAGTRAFCAGADIQDLNRKHERYPKRAFMEYFEELNIPVVALLQGFTLGGGFELSLGCHYRLIAPNGVVGLPEVDIGLLPGGQGTQRLPRLIGAEHAMKVMLSGEQVPAKIALQLKVVDDIISAKEPEQLLSAAIKFALSKRNDDLSKRRISSLPPPKLENAAEILKKYENEMKVKRKKQLAPLAIINCVRAAVEKPTFKDGVKVELEEFVKVLASKEAKALQHIFFAERAAAKVPENSSKPLKIKKVGILGAGTMGGGIAMCFANIGVEVLVIDREQSFLDRGIKVIETNYERSVKSGSRSKESVQKALALIKTSVSYDDLKDVDLVIEAVFEDLDLKKEIFAKLDKICKKECILASNTSYLNIDAMAEVTARPEKVMGMHFFSPANVMKLLENIRGKKTDDQTINTLMQIGQNIGKWPVLVNNRFGFVGNRMLTYYTTEAQNMLYLGVPLEKIDTIALQFGMPMGPFMMNDLTGLDIGYQARKRNNKVYPEKNIIDALVGAGRLGMKNGKGFYDYTGRDRKSSTEVSEVIKKVVNNLGNKKSDLTDSQIEERLFFPIINEGFKVLEERVADKPGDIDAVYVHGYNWPRITGGPMFYADQLGLEKVLKTLERYSKEYPNAVYFKPAKLLIDCVASGQTLEKFWSKNHAKYKFDFNKANL